MGKIIQDKVRNDMKTRSPFIVFCHIEKCAGSTVNYILNQNFPYFLFLDSEPKRRNNRSFDKGALSSLLRITRHKIHGIGGHTIRPFHNYDEIVPVFMFTFFRDPVKRWISHLNHRISVMKQDWNFESFIACEEFSNFQTKKICGEADAKVAIKILDKFSMVGLMEYFDESLLILNDRYPGNLQINYEIINKMERSEKKFSISTMHAEQIEKIKENNKEDIVLYNYIKDRVFPKQLMDYQGDLEENLRTFREQNKTYKFTNTDKVWLKMKNVTTKYLIQPYSLNNKHPEEK